MKFFGKGRGKNFHHGGHGVTRRGKMGAKYRDGRSMREGKRIGGATEMGEV